MTADLDRVLDANRAFYEAFERRDLDAMSSLWEHSDRVVCTHPGWSRLRGWGAVSGSWFAIFTGPTPLQVILTNVHAEAAGDVAWVTVDENLLGEQINGTVSALNLFVRDDDGEWRMVAHHASPVANHEAEPHSPGS